MKFKSLFLITFLIMVFLASCNTTLPTPIAANTTIAGSIQKWTLGTRVLKANLAIGNSGTFATLATTTLTEAGTFEVTLPSTVQANQGLYGFSGISCLQVSPNNLGIQDFFSLASFHGVGKSTGIVALASEKGLHGWMFATQDGSVSGTCNVTGGSITFALNLRAGWNQVALEIPNETSIRYVSAAIPANAVWGYATRSNNGNIIASPVGTFRIGEAVQLKALDQNENEISGVTWYGSSDIVSISETGVLTAKRLGAFTITATKTPNLYLSTEPLYTYGFELGAGTLKNNAVDGLQTAFIAKYRDANLQASKTALSLSVTGPLGWNNNSALQIIIPAEQFWAEKRSNIPVLNGSYTAQGATLGATSAISSLPQMHVMPIELLAQRLQNARKPQSQVFQIRPNLTPRAAPALSFTTTIDTSKSFLAPTFLWNNLSASGFLVTHSIPYSPSGETTLELRDANTEQLISEKIVSANNTSQIVFSGLSLDANKQYRLDAITRSLSFGYNASRDNPYWEKQFNVFQASLPVTFAPVIQNMGVNGGLQAGGAKLVLEGANFTLDSTVRFGATPATSVLFVSETKLEVIIPAAAQAGTVDVTVTNSKGTSTVTPITRFEYIKVTEFTPVIQGSLGSVLMPDDAGRVWFAGSESSQRFIGFITNTGAITKFPLSSGMSINGMTFGLGAIWFTSNNQLVKVTDTGIFSFYSLPNSEGTLVIGHDNAIWMSSPNRNKISRYDATGQLLGEITTPSNVRNLKRGPDQSMWYIANTNQFGGNLLVGKINAAREVREFVPSELVSGGGTSILDLIPAGNSIFSRVVFATQSNLGRIEADTSSSTFETGMAIGEITFGLDNRFWYTRQNLGALSTEPILETLTLARERKAYLVGVKTGGQFSFDTISSLVSTSGFMWFIRNGTQIGVIQLNP